MLVQSDAMIYLAEQRGCSQKGNWHRSYHTFNFGNYVKNNREAFGGLQALNEDTLKAGASIKVEIPAKTACILIPMVGGLEIEEPTGKSLFIEAGQIYIFSDINECEIQVTNPYEKEWVNYLHLEIKQQAGLQKVESFSIDQKKNKLIPLFNLKNEAHTAKAFIGKFMGRKEGFYHVEAKSRGLFVYVVEGVFEVQDRLLQSKDGLALWGVKNLDLESLSNNAILLLLDIDLS